MGRIMAACSGCGGVGKSTVALSIAICAARRGMKTILLDASGASRSCDLMLGLESIVVIDMMDVIKQQSSIQSALYQVPGQSSLRFACASLYEGVSLGELSGILLALRAMSDLLIVDLPSGPFAIAEGILDENDAILLLTRPDDISIRALERMMSAASFGCAGRHLVVSRISGNLVKKKAQYPVASVEMILDMPSSGSITEDEAVAIGASRGKPAIDCSLRAKGEFEKLLKRML